MTRPSQCWPTSTVLRRFVVRTASGRSWKVLATLAITRRMAQQLNRSKP